MPKLTLKNIGQVALGGKRPGEQFAIDCDEDGVPTDIYWRRRLRDEEVHNCGVIVVVASPAKPSAPAEPAAPAPEPSASPAPAPARSRKA